VTASLNCTITLHSILVEFNTVVNEPNFEAQTWPEREITSPNPAQARYCFWSLI